jgi:hypothetical protein
MATAPRTPIWTGEPEQLTLHAGEVAEGDAMDEAAWLSCEDPRKMLVWARATATDRELRLFACAFWRWHAERVARSTGGPDPEMSRALDYAERWAESSEPPQGSGPEFSIAFRWHPLFARDAFDAAGWTIRGSAVCGREWIGMEEQAQDVFLLRDIFGNPFRLVATNLVWLTPTVAALAQGIYDHQTFESLPILADALEDAGCIDPDILSHCRGPGPHVRGCWVIDLLLGKT